MDKQEMYASIGRVMYERYSETRGGKTYDGKPIPTWDDPKIDLSGVRDAWIEAAKAAVAEYEVWRPC